MTTALLENLLETALTARPALVEPGLEPGFLDERHESACRLFNGFTEGQPQLVADLYGKTLVLHNYADKPAQGEPLIAAAQAWFLARLPWLQAIVVKTRNGQTAEEKRGALVFGSQTDRKIRENGIWYACDPQLNRDASFYLDTRNVRRWAQENLSGKTVLNTFAYTGSLGVAALAGGAAQVVQLDLNKNFLNVAKTSYTLNGFPIHKAGFRGGDFFPQISRMKQREERFDCVFLDPPIYSATAKGVVDLGQSYTRLINKVRPLINDGGWLVAINNALFLKGVDYLRELEALGADGYLKVEELIPVPADFSGAATETSAVADPAPFNHATKIAVLRVRRKA